MAEIGPLLREARMRARIDITEVESRTKIRAKYLRAIENEEWDLLPGPVYVKSFLRTYGDYLGLDSRMLVDEFRRRYERPSDHDLRPMSSLRRERERERDRDGRRTGPLLSPRVIVGLVLVAVVAVLYVIGRGSTPTKPAPAGGTSVPAARAGTHGRHHRHTSAGAAAPARRRVRAVTLRLVPTTGSVYVCVVNEHGTRLIPGVIYRPGETIPVVRSRELLVTLGNNAVQMTVNGRTVPVAASAAAIALRVLPTGVRPLSSSQAPTCA